MAELRGLDDVDWGHLHHAYGAAVDVPGLLKKLNDVNSTEEELRQVQSALWGNVFHQGSVWQVTSWTIPFFLDILVNGPENNDLKRFLVTYVHHLATGYPEDYYMSRPDPEKEFASVQGKVDPGTEPDYSNKDIDERFQIWVRDCYVQVEENGIEGVMVPLLSHSDEDVAEAAIFCVANFPRKSHITLPALEDVMRSETFSARRRALCGVSYATLLPKGDPLDPLLNTLGSFSESENMDTEAVRILCCAIALAGGAGLLTGNFHGLIEEQDGDDDIHVPHTNFLTNLITMLPAAPGSEEKMDQQDDVDFDDQ